MFTKARWKLTGWYLLIIMLISMSFSSVIYRVLTLEIDRLAMMQRRQLEQQLNEGNSWPFSAPLRPSPYRVAIDPQLLQETRQRLLARLLMVNGGILLAAGVAGYMLAGKTLEPIQLMVQEQNQFITDASHELKTPITALKSAIEVHLRDAHLTLKEAKALIRNNLDEVNMLQSLTEGLLQLAHYQKPFRHSRLKTVSLKTVTTQALKQVTPLALKRHITLLPRLLSIQLEADPYALTDIFVILLDNAIKYSNPHSRVWFSQTLQNGWVYVVVKDEGVGIETTDLPHIFDRFYRADRARSKTEIGGYGLGLAIAKKIAKQHQGTLTVSSKINQGSIFTLSLPQKQAPAYLSQDIFS